MAPRASFAIYLSMNILNLFRSQYTLCLSTIISRLFFTVFSTRHQSCSIHTNLFFSLAFLWITRCMYGIWCDDVLPLICTHSVPSENTNTNVRSERVRDDEVMKKEMQINLFSKICRPYHLEMLPTFFRIRRQIICINVQRHRSIEYWILESSSFISLLIYSIFSFRFRSEREICLRINRVHCYLLCSPFSRLFYHHLSRSLLFIQFFFLITLLSICSLLCFAVCNL